MRKCFTRSELQPLQGMHVLVSAQLQRIGQCAQTGFVNVLLKSVDLFDYETGKKQVASRQDHCWITLTSSAWRKVQQLEEAIGLALPLYAEVTLVAQVQPYRRSDFSQDFGLQLLSEYPLTRSQLKVIKQENLSCHKYQQFGRQDLLHCAIAYLQHEAKTADWRTWGCSLSAAQINIETAFRVIYTYLSPSWGDEYLSQYLERGTCSERQKIAELRNQTEKRCQREFISYSYSKF